MNYERIKMLYELNQFEPILYFKNLFFHYEILHKKYEEKIKNLVKNYSLDKKFSSTKELVMNIDRVPHIIREEVRFYGNSLLNHNFFFEIIKKFEEKSDEDNYEKKIDKFFLEQIKRYFLNLDGLKKKIMQVALEIKGNG
jgi:superoxide dismutase